MGRATYTETEKRILAEAELQRFLPPGETPNFLSRVKALLSQQEETWPMLREAVAGLADMQYRKLSVKGSEVFVQFNPKRIVSTAARVDSETIKSRPCFLCAENLPPEEKGIAFGEEFVVLCNPFPVLKNHLVIAARRHLPQTIEGQCGALLNLARELGSEWFAIYNGPRCGASAPDHLHFQACSREIFPIIADVNNWDRQAVLKAGMIKTFTLRDYRLKILVARSREREALSGWFERVVGRLAAVTRSSEEPMLNLVATCDDGEWTLIVFPRGRHRPSCYDAEGAAKLTVSPAAIDLAGVMVVPEPDHFARIGAADVEQIYAEVTLDDERFGRLIAKEYL